MTPSRPSSKKARPSPEEARNDRLLRARHPEEERLVHDQDALSSVQEERLPEATPRQRVQTQGEADLLVGADVGPEARLPPVQDPPEESARKDRRRVRGQGILLQGERQAGRSSWRNALPHAKGQRVEQGERVPSLEGHDELSEGASEEVQEQIPQEEQRGIDERVPQGEVRRIPLQQDMAHPEEGGWPKGPDAQRQAADTVQDQAGGGDTGLSRLC